MNEYGEKPIEQNWNRMRELSNKHELSKIEQIEFDYRIAVQNEFSNNGKMPEDWISIEEAKKINKSKGF